MSIFSIAAVAAFVVWVIQPVRDVILNRLDHTYYGE